MTVTTGAQPSVSTSWRPGRPVDLRSTLWPLVRGGGDPTHRSAVDGTFWRVCRTPLGPSSLALRHQGDAVQATAWGAGAEWAIASVPDLLGARDDVSGFAPAHPLLRELHSLHPGMRIPRTGLVLDSLVPTVLEQKVTGIEARQSWRELVWRFGEPAPGPAPRGMRVPPAAATWSRIPSWEWHRAGVDPGRARTIVAAAEVAQRLDESLTLPRDERLRRLRAVPGVGEWTAAEVAQRAWGDADAVSVGDFHLPALVGWALAGRPVDDDGMLELLACYPGHRHRAVRLVELSGTRKPAFGPRMPVGDIRGL